MYKKSPLKFRISKKLNTNQSYAEAEDAGEA